MKDTRDFCFEHPIASNRSFYEFRPSVRRSAVPEESSNLWPGFEFYCVSRPLLRVMGM